MICDKLLMLEHVSDYDRHRQPCRSFPKTVVPPCTGGRLFSAQSAAGCDVCLERPTGGNPFFLISGAVQIQKPLNTELLTQSFGVELYN